MGFHTHSGWEWARLPDGGVEITRRNAVGNVLERHTLTDSEWASVVASTSMRGENGERHTTALRFHNECEP